MPDTNRITLATGKVTVATGITTHVNLGNGNLTTVRRPGRPEAAEPRWWTIGEYAARHCIEDAIAKFSHPKTGKPLKYRTVAGSLDRYAARQSRGENSG